MKRLEREAKSPPSSVDVRKTWIFVPRIPYTFSWRGGFHDDCHKTFSSLCNPTGWKHGITAEVAAAVETDGEIHFIFPFFSKDET
jgi:hypothetical protein